MVFRACLSVFMIKFKQVLTMLAVQDRDSLMIRQLCFAIWPSECGSWIKLCQTAASISDDVLPWLLLLQLAENVPMPIISAYLYDRHVIKGAVLRNSHTVLASRLLFWEGRQVELYHLLVSQGLSDYVGETLLMTIHIYTPIMVT